MKIRLKIKFTATLLILSFLSYAMLDGAVFPVTYVTVENQIPKDMSTAFNKIKKDIVKAYPDGENKLLKIIGFQSFQNLSSGRMGWYLIVRVLDNSTAESPDNIIFLGVIVTDQGNMLKCGLAFPISFCYPITKDLLGCVNIYSSATHKDQLSRDELDIDIFFFQLSNKRI